MVRLTDLLRRPLLVAPMAGGPSTPELVVAAGEAGALGFLAAGYQAPSCLKADMAQVRSRSSEPFGVNVFVPGSPAGDARGVARYLATVEADAEAVGAALGPASWDDDHYEDKVALLLADPPPAVSFTFGCPSGDVVSAFDRRGTLVAVTVTDPEEAARADAAGAHALCVQGPEAGAHRGTFENRDRPASAASVISLVEQVARVSDLPQIAAGGIMGPSDLSAARAAGATAAECGTAFLRCPESGAHPAYKAALADPRFSGTVVTRAFSGRPARGLRNRFVSAHADAPSAYPEINNATRALRAAAAGAGDTGRMSLWAGTGYRHATERPAGEIVELLSPPGS